jgi:hypothetical protein
MGLDCDLHGRTHKLGGMRGSAVRRVRGVLVLSVAVLPWAVAAQGGHPAGGASPVGPESPAAIESLTTALMVTADRPVLSVALKRTEARVPWATPAGRSNLHLPLGLVHAPWPAVPIERSEPLAVHLAGRGPPLALAA